MISFSICHSSTLEECSFRGVDDSRPSHSPSCDHDATVADEHSINFHHFCDDRSVGNDAQHSSALWSHSQRFSEDSPWQTPRPSMVRVRRVSALSSPIHRSSRSTVSKLISPANCTRPQIKASHSFWSILQAVNTTSTRCQHTRRACQSLTRVSFIKGIEENVMSIFRYRNAISDGGISLDIRWDVSRPIRHLQYHTRKQSELQLNVHYRLWVVSLLFTSTGPVSACSQFAAEVAQPIVDI